ncbi:MAG: hypothetical protein E7585_04085 [Ruminococcaceae bacterium]|nr:hypothetical protein [Oscillospiraceae bacterium]
MRKSIKKLLLATCVGVCALALAACGRGKDFSAGELMSAEEARAYREKLLAQKAEAEKNASPEQTVEETPQEEAPEAPFDLCYYTASGSVWHYAKNCSYIKNADRLLWGNIESAAAAGKLRPCSRCASMFAAE